MIRNINQLPVVQVEAVHGGNGMASFTHFLQAGEIQHNNVITTVTRVELEINASIGKHLHSDDEEVYIIIEGNGEYIEDDKSFQVSSNDVLILRQDHYHSLQNTGISLLVFFAIVARSNVSACQFR